MMLWTLHVTDDDIFMYYLCRKLNYAIEKWIIDVNHMSCSSSCFPCVGVRLIYWSLRSTATFVISFHRSLLLAFSLNFSSSSAFLRSLFTQSSHLSCGLPRFLEPSCLVVSALFGSLSSFIRTMCPAHFIRLLTILPTIQALVPTSSLRSFILRLSTLLTPAIFLIQLFSHTCSLLLCRFIIMFCHFICALFVGWHRDRWWLTSPWLKQAFDSISRESLWCTTTLWNSQQ